MNLLVSISSSAYVLLSYFLHFMFLLGYFPLLNNIYQLCHIDEIYLEGHLICRCPIIMRFKGCFIIFIKIWTDHFLLSFNTCLTLFMREVLGFRYLYKALCGLPLLNSSKGITPFHVFLPTQGQNLQTKIQTSPTIKLVMPHTSS